MRIEFWNTTFKTKDYILIFIHFHSKYLVHVYVFRHLDMKYIYIYSNIQFYLVLIFFIIILVSPQDDQ